MKLDDRHNKAEKDFNDISLFSSENLLRKTSIANFFYYIWVILLQTTYQSKLNVLESSENYFTTYIHKIN